MIVKEPPSRQAVTFEEITYSNMLTLNALVELLSEKGVLTKLEILQRVKKLPERDEGAGVTKDALRSYLWRASLAAAAGLCLLRPLRAGFGWSQERHGIVALNKLAWRMRKGARSIGHTLPPHGLDEPTLGTAADPQSRLPEALRRVGKAAASHLQNLLAQSGFGCDFG
jgi:hypothetical protein